MRMHFRFLKLGLACLMMANAFPAAIAQTNPFPSRSDLIFARDVPVSNCVASALQFSAGVCDSQEIHAVNSESGGVQASSSPDDVFTWVLDQLAGAMGPGGGGSLGDFTAEQQRRLSPASRP
jgi:hypothetical protein